jgi:hypothetical protein
MLHSKRAVGKRLDKESGIPEVVPDEFLESRKLDIRRSEEVLCGAHNVLTTQEGTAICLLLRRFVRRIASIEKDTEGIRFVASHWR